MLTNFREVLRQRMDPQTNLDSPLRPRLGMQLMGSGARDSAVNAMRNVGLAAGALGGVMSGTGMGAVPGMLSQVTDMMPRSVFGGVDDEGLGVLNTAQSWQKRGQAMANGGEEDTENMFSRTPSTERYYRRQFARNLLERSHGQNIPARMFLRFGGTRVSPFDQTPSGRSARGLVY